MNIRGRFRNWKGLNKDVTKELSTLPQLETKSLMSSSRLQARDANPDVCTYVIWNRVERQVIFTVPIPVGFKRDLTEKFEMFISMDNSFLRLEDEVKKKPAEIKVLDDEGNEINMECTIEVFKKWMRGELLFNVMAKGFVARTFLEVDQAIKVNYLDQTSFSNNNQVLIEQVLGYSCLSCKTQNQEEIAITLTPGLPFIVLADGTKIEDAMTFDALLNGQTSMIINIPCHIIAELIIEPIS